MVYEPEPASRVTFSAYERVPQMVVRAIFAAPDTVALATTLFFASRETFAFSERGVRSVKVASPSSGVPSTVVFDVPVFVKLPLITDVVTFGHGVEMSVWMSASALEFGLK